jgi:signal transduction histidine kinase
VERGDLETALGHTGTQEIDAVVDGFNEMVEQLRDAHITEKEKRRLEQERAEQLASVGQLAAGLAHEFRNPLSSVKAVVEVLAAESRRDEGRRDILLAAAGELDRMDQILRDLLQYARPRLPAAAVFDLNSLVAEMAGLLMPSGNGKPRVCLPTEQVPDVLADPSMVRQVVTNLLLNAEQAQRGMREARIVVTTGYTGSHAWCRVQDDGPGVPSDRAQSIFHPFTTTKPRGTGLGLAISRRVVEMQGGKLVLDNPGAPGASFSFTLPLAAAPESRE